MDIASGPNVQNDKPADEDIGMADAGTLAEATQKSKEKSSLGIKTEASDVKLEDLFADVDSDDEEFPSSRKPENKQEDDASSSGGDIDTPTSSM